MTHLDMQNLNRMIMKYILESIHVGMPLFDKRENIYYFKEGRLVEL